MIPTGTESTCRIRRPDFVGSGARSLVTSWSSNVWQSILTGKTCGISGNKGNALCNDFIIYIYIYIIYIYILWKIYCIILFSHGIETCGMGTKAVRWWVMVIYFLQKWSAGNQASPRSHVEIPMNLGQQKWSPETIRVDSSRHQIYPLVN